MNAQGAGRFHRWSSWACSLTARAATAAAAVLAVSAALALAGCGSSPAGSSQAPAGQAASSAKASFAHGQDVVIDIATVGPQASFYQYDADGTTVELFAVEADDGSVRLALNTCQVCNGSPYAYFVQEEQGFVCQNCMNVFSTEHVGIVSGGCNPVPITSADFTVEGDTITIPAAFLDDNAERFTNWKRF